MDVSLFLLLSCFGLAVIAQAQDCSKPTGGANMGLSDADILQETFPDGSKATFVCNIGYRRAEGVPTVTCTAGTWSPLTLKCKRKSCGSPGDVANGQINFPEGIEFGDKIYITCNKGYILVGKNELYCGADGWMGRLPSCEVVTCEPPSQVENGFFSPVLEIYDYRAAVQYSCQKDYTLNGSIILSCSENAKFQPDPPVCVKVNCPEITSDILEWVGGSRPPYGYRAAVTLQCVSGYTMIGSASLTCDINSRWSPEPPRCERKQTTPSQDKETPTASPTPDDNNQNSGNNVWMSVGIAVAVIIAIAVIIAACYHFGGFSFISKKKTNGECGRPVGAALLETGRGLLTGVQ
uniref:membrane cofactor protein-like isoform X2 n=1 Tax=Doryrhamphus excisus TaxID=161450 RepID=UPI0025AE1CC9|nr:membrane cofactor protein-like isoform X2 [Doryrhamphus excisus]